MRKLFLLVVLAGGCATTGLKPLDAERVPEHAPEGAQRVAALSVVDLRALARACEVGRVGAGR